MCHIAVEVFELTLLPVIVEKQGFFKGSSINSEIIFYPFRLKAWKYNWHDIKRFSSCNSRKLNRDRKWCRSLLYNSFWFVSWCSRCFIQTLRGCLNGCANTFQKWQELLKRIYGFSNNLWIKFFPQFCWSLQLSHLTLEDHIWACLWTHIPDVNHSEKYTTVFYKCFYTCCIPGIRWFHLFPHSKKIC